MLIQAAANEWKVPASECSAANSVITHKPSGRTTTYGKVAEAAAKLEPPKEIKLKDVKDWKIAGKPLKRLDTLRQADRQDDLRHRHQDAGHADRDDPGRAGARRQGEELRRRQGDRHGRRQEGRAGRRQRGRGRRRHVLERQDRRSTRCRSSGTRPRTQGLERHDRRSCSRRASMPRQAFVGNKAGDAKHAIAGAAAQVSRRSTATPTRTTPPWSR